MSQKKIVVYAVSDDYKIIKDIEKILWANKQYLPFGESSMEIAPITHRIRNYMSYCKL